MSTDYKLQQLMSAEGWRWVSFADGKHEVRWLHMIGLASTAAMSDPMVIVGISYNPVRGWFIVDLENDFCGLLPPGGDMVSFENHAACGHLR